MNLIKTGIKMDTNHDCLPEIEYIEKAPSKTYYVAGRSASYSEFCKEFTEIVGADCHAITIDDEIIYNSYKPTSVRARLLDGIVRSSIIEYPHTLFVNIFRKGQDARVVVYMFSVDCPWFVVVKYTANQETLTVEYYKSQKYVDRFVHNPNLID